jgi:rubrerythrin
MTSNDTLLAGEMEILHRKEKEMYEMYSNLLLKLKNSEIKERIRLIRDQELAHIKMVADILSILGLSATGS